MHEQSETTQRPDGSWVNVYGRHTPQAGQPLPVRYPYESASYPTVDAASVAAARRSHDEGRQQYDPVGPFPGQPLAHGGPVANIGPAGHDPAAITQAVALYRQSAHQALLAHRDRLRAAIARQPIRPTVQTTPAKLGSKKSGSKNKNSLGQHPLAGKPGNNPSGADRQGQHTGGGTPGDPRHGRGELGVNGTAGAMAVAAPRSR